MAAFQVRVLTFDSSVPRHVELYRWLHGSAFLSLNAGSEQMDTGRNLVAVNAAILDKIEAISDEDIDSKPWPWLAELADELGYGARSLQPGVHEIVLKQNEYNRLERAIDASSKRVGAPIQRKYFVGDDGLFEFFAAADKRDPDDSKAPSHDDAHA